MKTEVIYKAEHFHLYEREWLKSYRLFSQGDFYDAERNQFGTLRLLNNNIRTGKGRLNQHHHKDLEIIIIPISGAIEYTDSKSNRCIAKENDVIVINAGSGIYYAINSANPNKEASYLKIWILPRTTYLTPLHQTGDIDVDMLDNRFQYIVTPDTFDLGVPIIRQDAWIADCQLDPKSKITYKKKNPKNGIFIRCARGDIEVRGHRISEGDCIAFEDKKDLIIEGITENRFLLLEVPMDVTLYDTYDPIIIPPKM